MCGVLPFTWYGHLQCITTRITVPGLCILRKKLYSAFSFLTQVYKWAPLNCQLKFWGKGRGWWCGNPAMGGWVLGVEQ